MQCGNRRYQIYPKAHSGLALTSHGTNNGNNSGRYSDSDGNVFVANYSGLDNQLWEVIPTPPIPGITQQIDVDTLVQDSIDITGGAKYYQFTAQVTGLHTIQFTNIPDFVELHAFLYHSVGGTLLTDSFSISPSTNLIITYTLQQGQSYYIRVIRRWDQGIIFPDKYTMKVKSPLAVSNGTILCLRNEGSKKFLNVDNGIDVDGTNVYQWDEDDRIEQRFKVDWDSQAAAYRIRVMCSSGGNNRVLHVADGANVVIQTPTSPERQLWTIHSVGQGAFRIVPKSDPALALTSFGEEDGGNVFVATYTGAQNQIWVDPFQNAVDIQADTDVYGSIDYHGHKGYYKFVPTVTGLYTIGTTDPQMDTHGFLFDSGLNLLEHNDDRDVNGLNFRISQVLKQGQTYYIRVNYWRNQGVGVYVLKVKAPTTLEQQYGLAGWAWPGEVRRVTCTTASVAMLRVV